TLQGDGQGRRAPEPVDMDTRSPCTKNLRTPHRARCHAYRDERAARSPHEILKGQKPGCDRHDRRSPLGHRVQNAQHRRSRITDQLATEARGLHNAMLDEIGEENVLALFKNTKARPFALQHVHTVAAVTCCGKTMATPLNFLVAKIDEIGRPIAEQLNRAPYK